MFKSSYVLVFSGILLFSGNMASGQDSTRADFDAFCDAMVGRWIGDVTWVSDAPGLGKKGDKVKTYCEIKRTEDGNALIGRFYGGNGSATWLTVYDAGTKQIREYSVNSGGSNRTNVYKKTDTGWSATTTGSNPDGKKIERNAEVTITDSGKTHTWTGTTTIDGEEQDPQHDVWQRVAK